MQNCWDVKSFCSPFKTTQNIRVHLRNLFICPKKLCKCYFFLGTLNIQHYLPTNLNVFYRVANSFYMTSLVWFVWRTDLGEYATSYCICMIFQKSHKFVSIRPLVKYVQIAARSESAKALKSKFSLPYPVRSSVEMDGRQFTWTAIMSLVLKSVSCHILERNNARVA